MSPPSTEKVGDLHDLPDCAPAALTALFAVAEEVIQRQIQLLGEGTPSEAPDLRQELSEGSDGIADPDQQSTMLTIYGDNQTKIDNVTNEFRTEDEDIPEHTATVGGVVGDAYAAIETAVGDLNATIDEAHKSENIVVEKNDEGEVVSRHLTGTMITELFTGLWVTVDKTYEEVTSVSDQAAEQARRIAEGETTFNRSPYNGSPTAPTASYPTGGPSDAVITPVSGSTGNAIVSTEDKPTAFPMMEYLIKEHGFTPAQAAGIVANAKFESGFDVEARGDFDKRTGQYTAHGLFQWRFDRHQGLLDFAAKPGEDLGDWRTHIDYMVQELNGGGFSEAASVVNNDNSSAAAVAAAFDENYERSSGITIGDRQSYANDLLGKWNKRDTTSRPSTETGLMV